MPVPEEPVGSPRNLVGVGDATVAREEVAEPWKSL